MVDAAVVMIENAHKGLEEFREHNKRYPKGQERWQLMAASASEVGPALFVSLLVITLSFVPAFALEGQSGRLLSSLAFTKPYSLQAAAFTFITLRPRSISYLLASWVRPYGEHSIQRIKNG